MLRRQFLKIAAIKVASAVTFSNCALFTDNKKQRPQTKRSKRQLSEVKKLIKTLEDGDSYAKIDAATSLGEIGDSSAVPALIKALDDQDFDVRESAAGALGKIKDERALSKLEDVAEDDPEKLVRDAALEAIESIEE